jgi:hypothetical protein
MTKRDYELIAALIRDHGDKSRIDFARAVASELLNTNPRFNMTRFLDACRGRDAFKKRGSTPVFRVTIREIHTYTVAIIAKDVDEARANAIIKVEAGDVGEPDSIFIDHEECDTERT